MPQKTKKSSISINVSLNEAMTEKLVIIILTALTSFSSGLAYANYQQDELPQVQPVEVIEDTVK